MLKQIYTSSRRLINNLRYKKISDNFASAQHQIKPNVIHLSAAIDWLCRAQDATPDDGVAALYNLVTKRWRPSYPETTGYIISTFLKYAAFSDEISYQKRAIKMGDWEINIQLPTGACRGGQVPFATPRIFNTGQIILGWLDLYRLSAEKKYLHSAIRAADWLISQQDSDGKWQQYTMNGAKTYHARVAWPLLKLAKITNERRYQLAAEKNLTWVLKQQKPNGWFSQTSLAEPGKPWTHLIGYTLEGLIESYLLTKEQKLLTSVIKASNGLLREFEARLHKPHKVINDFLPGSFDKNWESRDAYSCLTGNAQIACVWFTLSRLTRQTKFLIAAKRLNSHVKYCQILNNPDPCIAGGVAGSFPIHGHYCSFSMINWAAKFFADALMLEEKIDDIV
ncbi:MAG TPA: hypothetical protein DDX47_00440 [Candidatus Jacksonbacteria bacterium]|nr:MAG: hypothetical protein UW45_C0005G0017 [Parcubacteria group bacterium GW2011_GWC2_44_22]OGY76463.1 MAG: hypothetical protein A2295_02315 [Candidatus Jacksonbacteria bacterium RIFOXYB2_FULL_44_15]OGY76834.1 MAG: hypothetical protein A2240_04650 [Candidatus Jacksonbacteria bacterium RIFOXYA2_FULL_43_12]OGY82193.1 MAG: hypothetical protein A2550_05820 [Candidatus Jacksonbacteria bacterium RIFOXYD2_FULL_43_21]HBH45824.1 hypothetical protein [Candidatus Jacksonbacteria bacterium]